MAQTKVHVRVAEGGRIVIPATFRKAMAICEGDTLTLEMEPDGLKLRTRADGLKRAAALMAPYIDPSRSRVDEFLAERRRTTGE